jgi:hypothetical protein
MGQAKQRGSKEDRTNEAKAEGRGKTTSKVHAFLNETRTDQVLLDHFPCAECGAIITPDPLLNEIMDSPVKHGIQTAACPACSSLHFVISASTKADCIALEPSFALMQKDFLSDYHSNN